MTEGQRQALAARLTPRLTAYNAAEPLSAKQHAGLLMPQKEVLFGGAAGGRKSSWLLHAALQYVDVPGYAAILFRKSYKQLSSPGALMDRSQLWLAGTDARWRGLEYEWLFPSGAILKFGFLRRGRGLDEPPGAGVPVRRLRRGHAVPREGLPLPVLPVAPAEAHAGHERPPARTRQGPVPRPLPMRGHSNPRGPGHEWVKQRFGIYRPDGDEDERRLCHRPAWVREHDRAFLPSKLRDKVERERVGGECSYWACIPSKTLLRPGEAVHGARDAAATAQVDIDAALAWRDFMVSNWDDSGAARWLADKGIDVLRGSGLLAGTGAVEVDGVTYTAEHVVLANGADAFVPPVPGLRELEGVWGTREATSLKEVPRRLVVLGGGAAGVELAQAIHRFGAEVAIVEGAPHLLSHDPRPLGEALGDALRHEGIDVVTGVQATRARRDGGDYVLELDDGRELRGDRLFVATGRRPRVQDIGLEMVGIEPDPRGVAVDGSLRAGERLWAIGDVNGIWPLTHVGEYEGDVVAANILGEPREANYEAVPRVTYTDPQAAAVGAAEAPFSATYALRDVPKAAAYTRAYADSNGFLTLLSDGDVLTGAYAFGPEAGEWMQQATLAIRARVPLDVLRDTIQPFPTFSEIHAFALKALRAEVAAAGTPVAEAAQSTTS